MKRLLALGEAWHGAQLDKIREILEGHEDLSGIFLEHPVNYQDSINFYLKNKKVDEKLRGFWKGSLKEGNDIENIDIYLLNFASEQKIPIVCIDSSKIQTSEYSKKSNIGYWFLRGDSRDEDMFENIIRVYKEGEKWIVLCGAGHLITEIHPRSGKKTLGARLTDKFGDDFSYIVLD